MSDYVLRAEDELPHLPTEDKNFNESVYVNGIDHQSGTGAWLRLGNRINEGYAELQMCIYLPDGQLACQFQKPALESNDRFEAGGMSYQVDAPLQKVSMQYDGPVMLLDDLNLLREPKRLFLESRTDTCRVDMTLSHTSPVHGGEPLTDKQPTMYGRDFSFGHFFQHMHTKAQIEIGGERFSIDGGGWRDHSWGPRYWTNIYFYRLLIVNFENGDGFTMLKITDTQGVTRRCGAMNVRGELEEILDVDLHTQWSDLKDPEEIVLGIRTAKRAEIMRGKVRSMAPLRNRRKVDGELLETRIAEGLTDWTWGEHRGRGFSEYIERLDAHGVPVGYPM